MIQNQNLRSENKKLQTEVERLMRVASNARRDSYGELLEELYLKEHRENCDPDDPNAEYSTAGLTPWDERLYLKLKKLAAPRLEITGPDLTKERVRAAFPKAHDAAIAAIVRLHSCDGNCGWVADDEGLRSVAVRLLDWWDGEVVPLYDCGKDPDEEKTA